MKNEKENRRSLYLERNKVNRLLMVAMAEDGIINERELQAMIFVLLRRFLTNDIKYDEFPNYCEECYGVSINEDKYKYINLNTFTYADDKNALSWNTNQEVIINNPTLKFLLIQPITTLLKERYKGDIDLDKLLSTYDGYLLIYRSLEYYLQQVKELSKGNVDDNEKEEIQLLNNLFGDINDDEIKNIIQNFHYACILARLVLLTCYNELNDKKSSAARSLFVDVNLLNDKEKKQELIDMYGVICSDDSIMDREREAFRVACKMFKLRHSSLLLQQIVEIYNEYGQRALLGESVFSSHKYKLTLVTKTDFNVSDYNYINDALVAYEIKGPLKEGVYQIFKRDRINKDERTYKFDRKMSSIAILCFSISALILYVFVSDLLHKIPDREYIFATKFIWLDSITDLKEWFVGNFKLYIFIAICIFSILLRFAFKDFKIRFLKRKFLKQTMYPNYKLFFMTILCGIIILFGCNLFATKLVIWIKTLFIPIVLLIMMLSIEWLIFMKSESSEKNKLCTEEKNNKNKSLYLLTFVAILLDMGLGSVEYLMEHANVEASEFIAKIASAIVLGAICFFSGKFLDMYRLQQKQDKDKMNQCINQIKEGNIKPNEKLD